MKKSKMMFISSVVSAFLCLFLLIISVFAWYVTNKKTNVTASTGLTADSHLIHFTDTVLAVRHCLSGDVITNTYERKSNGSLELIRSEIDYFDSSKTDEVITTFTASQKAFKISEILPGEYIDITIGYYMDESYDGRNYRFRLDNIDADRFMIDGKSHYVTGVFKYKNISLVDNNSNTPSDFTPDTSFTFFNEYNIDLDDPLNLRVNLFNHTWDNDYERLYYTFRIQEDFSQYYSLISQASTSYGNLLSKKKLSIGNIFIFG